MARRSLLVNKNEVKAEPVVVSAPVVAAEQKERSRATKIHIGAYYDPQDPVIREFRVLAVETRELQQDMLYEALQDYLAKKKAAKAFNN